MNHIEFLENLLKIYTESKEKVEKENNIESDYFTGACCSLKNAIELLKRGGFE